MSRLEKIAVVGAGTMGAGIAQKAAQEGLEVVLVDISTQALERGMGNIRATLNKGVERGLFSPEQLEQIMNRLKPTTSLEETADCQLVIEAVFEDKKVKAELFERLGKILGPEVVVGTNTSSFSVTELATHISHPERFLGLHFFYHPALNRLLEIIPGEKTSDEAMAVAWAFAARSKKVAILVADAPGFAVNRFFVPWLNEATRLLEEGVANIPTIDAAAERAFGIGMGPFKLMNATGVPISYHSCVSLADKLGPFYAPSKALTAQYEKAEPWNLEGDVDEGAFDAVSERLMGVVFVVCCYILDEKVCGIAELEVGAKVGLRWRRGPFELMNRLGQQKVEPMVKAIVDRYDDLSMPASLSQWLASTEPWQIPYVQLRIDGNVAYITFVRPEAMNALNWEVLRQLEKAFEQAEANPEVKTIVLEGLGKAFVAGADIGFFLKAMKDGAPRRVTEFATYGQQIFNRMAASDKWVVAKIEGLALGGGAELALACHSIVATPAAAIGFPETGIGIYPGLGGTQRTLRYLGPGLARYLVFTGQVLSGKEAHEIGLVEYLVEPGEADELIRRITATGEKPKTKADPRPEPQGKWAEIARLFSDEAAVEALLKGQVPKGYGELGEKMAKVLAKKAPLALAKANELISTGAQKPLEEALQMELDGLEAMFSTADAMEGISSIIERRRPQFKGS